MIHKTSLPKDIEERLRSPRVVACQERVKRTNPMGSYARNRVDLFTDLNVLVVMATDLSFIDRPI